MKKPIIIILALIIALSISCGDDDECPTCPEPVETDHLFYIAPIEGNLIKIFSVERLGFVDSIVMENIPDSVTMYLHVINNDSLLAVSAGGQTYFLNLDTRSIVDSINGVHLYFSRDSRYYLDIDTRILYSFPNHIQLAENVGGNYPVFDNSSTTISRLNWADSVSEPLGTEVSIYDIATASIIHGPNHFPGIYAYFHQISNIHSKCYFGAPGVDILGAVDYDDDSVRVMHRWDAGYQTLARPVLSPKDSLLYCYGVTLEFWLGVGDPNIYIFDARNEDSIGVITIQDMRQVGDIVISHDGKYMLARPFNEFQDVTKINLIDLGTNQVLGVYDCHFLPWSIASKYGCKLNN